jgi:hypothetical protein
MVFLSHVSYSDINSLVRDIDFPAIQDGPLYRVMFPEILDDEQCNEVIDWYTINMQRAFSSGTTFCKACTDDGEAIGFAGWVWIEKLPHNSAQKRVGENVHVPHTLDVNAWQNVSQGLMKERRRVLEGFDTVLRK